MAFSPVILNNILFNRKLIHYVIYLNYMENSLQVIS